MPLFGKWASCIMIWTTWRSCLLVLIGLWVQWIQEKKTVEAKAAGANGPLCTHFVVTTCLSLLSAGSICTYVQWMFPCIWLKVKSKSYRLVFFSGKKHWWLAMTFFPRNIPESASLVTEMCLVLGRTVWVNNVSTHRLSQRPFFTLITLTSVWSMD